MYTPAAMLDTHQRCHASLGKLLDHCAGFTPAQLTRAMPEFGDPTLLEQLYHIIATEAQWMSVVRGLPLAPRKDADLATIDSLRAFRERVVAGTHEYLHAATPDELSTRRRMTVWDGAQREYVPAHILLRIFTHMFDHKGKASTMCRLLGRPIPPNLNFPMA